MNGSRTCVTNIRKKLRDDQKKKSDKKLTALVKLVFIIFSIDIPMTGHQ